MIRGSSGDLQTKFWKKHTPAFWSVMMQKKIRKQGESACRSLAEFLQDFFLQESVTARRAFHWRWRCW
jgi:hypothetical protein